MRLREHRQPGLGTRARIAGSRLRAALNRSVMAGAGESGMRTSQLLRRVIAMDRRELGVPRGRRHDRREAGRVALLARPASVAPRRPWPARSIPTIAALRARRRSPAQRLAGAHDALMRHFATRPRRFILDPASRVERTALDRFVRPSRGRRRSRRGGPSASSPAEFDLLGYRSLSFSGGAGANRLASAIRSTAPRRADFWSHVPYLDAASADHKVIWELNRHQHWLALGRACWLTGTLDTATPSSRSSTGWMRSNPPLVGINWASMLELAFRCLSWIWALHFFSRRRSDGTASRTARRGVVDLLLGLDRQLTHDRANLSTYFSPNTHLIGEALALYVAGRRCRNCARAARWAATGRALLVEQIAQQISADGGHVERSTHYHRYTLDFYLLALAVARQTWRSAGTRRSPRPSNAWPTTRAPSSDDAGRLPLIGDDDGGSLFPICGRRPVDCSDSLALAAQLLDRPALAVGPPAEEASWMTGTAPPVRPRRTRRDRRRSRQRLLRVAIERGDHLVIDAGPHGYLNGGHAHADASSVTLSVRGQPLLIDPGTACYTSDPELRDRFRSTRYHNTLMVDGRPQSLAAGPFHWHSTASATAYSWRSEPGLDVFEGTHDGYRPLVHQRTVLARAGLLDLRWIGFSAGGHTSPRRTGISTRRGRQRAPGRARSAPSTIRESSSGCCRCTTTGRRFAAAPTRTSVGARRFTAVSCRQRPFARNARQRRPSRWSPSSSRPPRSRRPRR